MRPKQSPSARRTEPEPGGQGISGKQPDAAPDLTGSAQLQRVIEELETSQAQLEFANEELRAFNEEMATRNAELSALNAELHNLQLNASTAMVVLDRTGSVRSFTPLAKQPFNLRSTDVGRQLSDLQHNLHVPAASHGEAHSAEGHEEPSLDLAGMLHGAVDHATSLTAEVQDGSGHWFSLTVRPYVTLEQKTDGAVLVLVDVDALKRSERTTSAALEYAEAMLRTARDPLLVLRSDLSVNSASEAYYKLFRVTPAATEGRSFWEIAGGQWKRPRLRELLHGVLPRHSHFDGLEVVVSVPDLGLRTLLLNARPLDSPSGAAEMILLGMEDVTERQRLDDAVRLSEERFRALAQASAQIIWTADVQGLLVEDSLPWRAFTGQSYEQWRNRGWLDAIHADDRAETGKRWDESVAKQSVWRAQYRMRRADGVHRWIQTRAVPVFTHDNKIREWVGANTDITEQRQKAEELERTHDEAVRASRAKDDFLATLSHELRTPLSPILLLADEGADDFTLPEQVRADFATIATNIALEARLIDDLLDLTRVSRGKLRLELQTCNVEAVLRDALAVVANDIEGKHIRVVLGLHAAQAEVMGDPVRLQQVFWNVLRNAVHFTPQGGRIEVESRADSAGAQLTIAITDTGIGIAPDDLAPIFDAFTQGDVAPGAPRRSGGLGLGLAISRTMVEMHGGSIQAHSPGRGLGSTFVITLPLLGSRQSGNGGTADSAGAAHITSPSPASATGTSAATPRKVLLVDDHAATRSALRRLLERRNCVVLAAASISEGLTLASQQTIDVLISDIGLPDGDGRDLMDKLRRRHPHLHGIALSGYGMEADVAKSRLAGFADHLTKPVTVAMVERAMARIGASGLATSGSSETNGS